MSNSLKQAFETRMPHYIAEYVYNLCVECNIFYQNNHISGMTDEVKKQDFIEIIALANTIIEKMLYLLGIEIPEAM